MGMYTQFYVNCYLKNSTPVGVLTVLTELIVWRRDEPPVAEFLTLEGNGTPEAQAFIGMDRWDWIGNPAHDERSEQLLIDGLDEHGTDRKWHLKAEDPLQYQVLIGSFVQNYEEVIQKFWDYLRPWVDVAEGITVGFIKYEEYWNPAPIHAGQPITRTGMAEDRRGTWFGGW